MFEKEIGKERDTDWLISYVLIHCIVCTWSNPWAGNSHLALSHWCADPHTWVIFSLSSLGILIGIWFGSRITKLKLAIRCGMLISEATIYLACHNASPTLEEFVRDNFCDMLSFSPWWLIVIVSNRGNYIISFCVLYLNIGSPAFLFHHNAAIYCGDYENEFWKTKRKLLNSSFKNY